MKIGCGVTTYTRPEHLKFWLEQMDKFSPKNDHDVITHIANDSSDRKGIAFRKNECLEALQDCDYIFLFDDDCFSIKPGWADFFINASKASGQHHFMYLKETPTIKRIKMETILLGDNLHDRMDFITYNNCAGCMMFLTKEAIDKVGGYNKNYGYYGYEHAGYSNRIHAAGLTPLGKYTCPAGAGEYIYSLDYDFHLPFNKQLKHEPSLKNELHKLEYYLKQNKEVYDKDIQIYQPI